MGPPLWIIGVTLSLAATLFGTLGKVLLKLSHTSSQALWVKAAATVCVFLLNPVLDAISYAYAAQVRAVASTVDATDERPRDVFIDFCLRDLCAVL